MTNVFPSMSARLGSHFIVWLCTLQRILAGALVIAAGEGTLRLARLPWEQNAAWTRSRLGLYSSVAQPPKKPQCYPARSRRRLSLTILALASY